MIYEPFSRESCTRSPGLILQDKSDFQFHAVLGDFAVLDIHLLILHPGALHVFQCLVGTGDANLQGIIKKHEFTRPDKEDDRVRHIETLNSQTGPVFLTYRATTDVDEFISKKISEKPQLVGGKRVK